jgi:hypothetical protein
VNRGCDACKRRARPDVKRGVGRPDPLNVADRLEPRANAVPNHQVGVAMGAMNFFRALASAFAVAIMGAIGSPGSG